MNPETPPYMVSVRYYEGLKTPEGNIVSIFRGPAFEPYEWNTEDIDWGELNRGSRQLADSLLRDVRGWREVAHDSVDEFAELVIAKLPTDKKWRLWGSDIAAYEEKLYREKLSGRNWPECDYE